MEYNYGTRLYVWKDIAGACLSADIAVVVTADDVPHYCVVSFIQHPCLVGAYLGIWGTEQVGLDHVSCNVYIPYVVTGIHSPSLYMAVRVVANCMPPALYLLKQFGEHLNVLSYAEECGLGIILVQKVKYPRGDFRPWPVIKSEENAILFVGKIPDESREQSSDDFWRLDSHICNVYVGKSNNKKLPLHNIFLSMYGIVTNIRTALFLLCFLLFAGCAEKDIIGEKEMSELLADMLLADQSLVTKFNLMNQKDSILIYPSIMRKHGVTAEQYEAAVKYYLDDGDSYLNIVKETKRILSDKEKELSEIMKLEAEERDSRTINAWWAIDTLKAISPDKLKYYPYLRSLRWLVLSEDNNGEWMMTEPAIEDIPQNPQWWMNTLVPPQREFHEFIILGVDKREEKLDSTDKNKEIKSNEKVGRKLSGNTKLRRAAAEKRLPSFE